MTLHTPFPRYVTPTDAMLPAATLLAREPSTYAAALVRVLVARRGPAWTEKLLEMMKMECEKCV